MLSGKLSAVLAASFLSWALSAYIHFPSIPGNIYSDVVSFWFRDGVAAGLLPCIDYFFEYPPSACFIVYAARMLGGPSVEGYYMAFALMSLPAFLVLGWYMWRVAGLPAAAFALSPTLILYGVYNFDHFFAAFTALALYPTGRRWVSYVLLGLAASTKLFSAVMLPVLFLDRFSWRYVLLFLGGALPATLPVIVLRPDYVVSFVNYHASWGLENAWTVWLAQDTFSPSAKILGIVVAFILVGRALVLRRQISVEERSLLALSGLLLGSPVFTPQMAVTLIPLLASTTSTWFYLPLLEASNAGIILTWFWVEDPTHAWTLPQTMALARAACLAAVWVTVYSGYRLPVFLRLGRSRGHEGYGSIRSRDGVALKALRNLLKTSRPAPRR